MSAQKQPQLSASLADYLKAIHQLSLVNDAVHATDIATVLKVSKPSVTGALRLLAARGMIVYSPYSPISLTSRGTAVAKDYISRFDILRDFLIHVLHIEEVDADNAACAAEHVFSRKMLSRLTAFLEHLQQCRRRQLVWSDAEGFRCSRSGSVSCDGCPERDAAG